MEKIECAKVTLSSGKVVLLRTLLIRHLEQAEQIAGNAQGMKYIRELVKLLIVKIDGRDVKPVELENLDALLTVAEYMQVSQVVGNFVGDASQKPPQIETVFGGQ